MPGLSARVRMKRKADEIFALVAEIDEVLDTVRNSLDREREEEYSKIILVYGTQYRPVHARCMVLCKQYPPTIIDLRL